MELLFIGTSRCGQPVVCHPFDEADWIDQKQTLATT